MEAQMNISIDLLESNSEIERIILDALKTQIETSISFAAPDIIRDIKAIIVNSLKTEPEYTSLISGKLRAEFGIANVSTVDTVINAMAETINFTMNPIKISRSGLSGGFTLTMMQADNLGGVLDINAAQVLDDSGYSLPWLRWLLLENNKAIVKNYDVRYTSAVRSRSGMAIMVPSSGSWRVPPEFAGSRDSNWTTRAVERSEKDIYSSIQKNIEKYI
jgi:hypothetical protein